MPVWRLASDIHFPVGQGDVRGEHRQAAKRAAADIEGHSEAAEYSPTIDRRLPPKLPGLLSAYSFLG
jgi:hypothetical protein